MGAEKIEVNYKITIQFYDKRINIDSFILKLKKKLDHEHSIEGYDTDEI